MRIVIDNPGNVFCGRIGVHQITGLPIGLENGDNGIVPMEKHLVIQLGVNPGLNHIVNVAKVHHHASMVKIFADNVYFHPTVVSMEVAALTFIVEQAMAVAELDMFGDFV
jgi:hypothetical protein